jgi:hypothetical protein
MAECEIPRQNIASSALGTMLLMLPQSPVGTIALVEDLDDQCAVCGSASRDSKSRKLYSSRSHSSGRGEEAKRHEISQPHHERGVRDGREMFPKVIALDGVVL